MSKGSNTLSGRVSEKLDVVQDATATDEAIEISCPSFLPFVAMTKLDVRMNEGN